MDLESRTFVEPSMVYRQHFEHARAMVDRRLTYLNVYLTLSAAASTAMVALLPEGGLSQTFVAILAAGLLFYWIVSIFFIREVELIGTHVTHNLVVVRKIHRHIRRESADLWDALSPEAQHEGGRLLNWRKRVSGRISWFRRWPAWRLIESEPKPTDFTGGISFHRSLFDPHRSMEALIGLIGSTVASLGLVFLISQYSPYVFRVSLLSVCFFDLALVIAMPALSYGFWKLTLRHAADRHRGCCVPAPFSLKKYTLPSTYTSIARHVFAFEIISHLLVQKSKLTVLEGGSGVIEPFVLKEMLQNSRNRPEGSLCLSIHSVERDKFLAESILSLARGVGVPTEQIAQASSNVQEDGTRRKNRDLTEPGRIKHALERLMAYGLDARQWFDHLYTEFSPGSTEQIIPLNASLEKYVANHETGAFGLAVFGALFLNMRKEMTSSEFATFLANIRDVMQPSGMLFVGTTPAEYLEPHGILELLERAGFRLVAAIPEKIVVHKGRDLAEILGDIGLILTLNEEETSSGESTISAIAESFSGLPVIDVSEGVPQTRINDAWPYFYLPVGEFPSRYPGMRLNLDLTDIRDGGEIEFDFASGRARDAVIARVRTL